MMRSTPYLPLLCTGVALAYAVPLALHPGFSTIAAAQSEDELPAIAQFTDVPSPDTPSSDAQNSDDPSPIRRDAETLNDLATYQYDIGHYQTSLETFQAALQQFRQINDREGEARVLSNLGQVYTALGQYEEAIAHFQPALQLRQDLSDRRGEALTLKSLGSTYYALGNPEEAIAFSQEALATFTSFDEEYRFPEDFPAQADALNTIGDAQLALGQTAQAAASFQQALNLAQEHIAAHQEVEALMGLGQVSASHSDNALALDHYQHALAIATDIQYLPGQGRVLSSIGDVLTEQEEIETAIFFYQQAVDVTEDIRANIAGLSPESREAYLATVSDTYRQLAELLLLQNRVQEAQAVLDLLKVQEIDEYLREIDAPAPLAEPAAPDRVQHQYEVTLASDSAIQLGQELTELARIPVTERTPEQRDRIAELRAQQQALMDEFITFLNSAEVQAGLDQLRQSTGGEALELHHIQSLRDNLRSLDQNAVLLYPFILEERLELVLVTPDTPPIRRTTSVTKAELNRAIAAFRSQLSNPNHDVTHTAQTLYTWLIQPIEADLAQANAETIIYAPDGQLRYVPLAALYDGTRWMVERVRINTITAASLTDLNTFPENDRPSVFAAAMTEGQHEVRVGDRPYHFSGLPFAGVEVEHLDDLGATTTTVLNAEFTPDVSLRMNDFEIVHLATHAAFVSGAPDDSFILFGNGEPVTLRDVQRWNLTDVDLIVLSACETAVGGALGDGREIHGLGYQMQRAGARAAIASLWSVDDGGTQVFMDAFYRALFESELTKAEALQHAQLTLINSTQPSGNTWRGGFEWEPEPQFDPTQLSHPYYWAPFILIGNGL